MISKAAITSCKHINSVQRVYGTNRVPQTEPKYTSDRRRRCLFSFEMVSHDLSTTTNRPKIERAKNPPTLQRKEPQTRTDKDPRVFHLLPFRFVSTSTETAGPNPRNSFPYLLMRIGEAGRRLRPGSFGFN